MWLSRLFLWFVDLIFGEVVSYAVEKVGNWVLATLVSLQIFGSVADPVNTLVTEQPKTTSVACRPEPNGNYYVDLGRDDVVEQCGLLEQGWDENQVQRKWPAPYGDVSRSLLPNPNYVRPGECACGGDDNDPAPTPKPRPEGIPDDSAYITLFGIDPNVEYTLAIAVLEGEQDDSFAVYLPDDPNPVFGLDAEAGRTYRGDGPIDQGVNLYTFALDREVTARYQDLRIRFENKSSDSQSRTAFYYLWMGPTISKETALANASPKEYACLRDDPQVQNFDLGGADTDLNIEGWGESASGEPDAIHGDTTRRRQTVGSDNLLVVPSCALNDYSITVAWQNGACDDSFDILVNDTEIARIEHNPNRASASPMIREFTVPEDVVTSDSMEIVFSNRSTENCGRASVWYVDVVRLVDPTVTAYTGSSLSLAYEVVPSSIDPQIA